MTMKNRFRTGLTALMGLSIAVVSAVAAEEKISPEKLPSAVKRAIKKNFPEANIRGAAKEVEDGKTTYEVELTVEGRSIDVAMDAKGKILEVEEEIPVAKLPEAVKKGLAKRFPGARIAKAEAVTKGKGGPVRYEIAIKGEVVLTAKGKVVQAEEEDEEDERPAAKASKKKENEDKDDEDEDDEDDDHKSRARAGKKESPQEKGEHKPAAKGKKKEKKEDRDDDEDDEDEDEDD
jgi:putative PepSY-like beta-lactamase-inhibitor